MRTRGGGDPTPREFHHCLPWNEMQRRLKDEALSDMRGDDYHHNAGPYGQNKHVCAILRRGMGLGHVARVF